MSRIIGYARVSTEDQNLDLQKLSIEKYAKEQEMELLLYVEKISTRKRDRTELNYALKAAAPDRFVVYKLDRLARSTKELYKLTDEMASVRSILLAFRIVLIQPLQLDMPCSGCLPSLLNLSAILSNSGQKLGWKLPVNVGASGDVLQ
ncbi:hypothetical protein HNO89_002745 [Sporosarcina luteola]|nr:hypothetical protein [Sporosarcina luteola]